MVMSTAGPLATRQASHLPRKLREEVLIGGEGPQAVQVADGGRQRLQLVAAAVQLLQQRQTGRGLREQGAWGGVLGRGGVGGGGGVAEAEHKRRRK